MQMEKRTLQLGALAIACALLFRLASGWPITQWLFQPENAALIVFLETGRLVKMPSGEPQSELTEPPESAPTEPQKVQPVFCEDDALLVHISNADAYAVDVPALLCETLSWDLTQGGPAVLIVHSHATESYENTQGYRETSAYRTVDTDYNVVSVGTRIAQILEQGGIRAIHDTSLHDYPSYNDAYKQSRKSIAEYLQEYPSIRIVLDIHRDSAVDNTGKQYAATVQAGGQKSAKLMLVTGAKHEAAQENLALAVKLQALLEKQTPGICRDLILRSSAFNQDLCEGALLVEVGAAGNTHEQALLAAELLANSILTLAYGTSV